MTEFDICFILCHLCFGLRKALNRYILASERKTFSAFQRLARLKPKIDRPELKVGVSLFFFFFFCNSLCPFSCLIRLFFPHIEVILKGRRNNSCQTSELVAVWWWSCFLFCTLGFSLSLFLFLQIELWAHPHIESSLWISQHRLLALI